ncbi:hypothetical protein IE81DRAFT_27757 [Ceraceosorus guamensis]|uniref:Uncharacterized protein n=1 Tax=Ceraceosorus guamensis TaxID=1522189 RepID=A0A316W880_9BASI|nr:hypothetical protein IE81DRAFT_27757 [Ceraceosorus guamensis]PWN44253.1 hypothetical protein IE81DRAFT_27757 [Ceraceosorus guamensis]
MWFPLALAIILAVHGYRKGSLSASGALAAFIFGFSTMHNPSAAFGIMLIVFYLTGSRATKVKADIKSTLELEAEPGSTSPSPQLAKHKSATGGQRDLWQVICNALNGTIGALLFAHLHSGARAYSIAPHWINSLMGVTSEPSFCLLDNRKSSSALLEDPRTWILFSLGHFSASCVSRPTMCEIEADSVLPS